MKKINILILLSLISLFTLNSVVSIGIGTPISATSEDSALIPNTSQLSPRNARVAIYDEPNLTRPAYSKIHHNLQS